MDPLPDHQPVVAIDAQGLDEAHWERLSVGDCVRTADQFFRLMPPTGWVIGSFFTSDKQKVTGRTTYRRPASVRAWLEVAPQVARKLWQRWTQKTPSP